MRNSINLEKEKKVSEIKRLREEIGLKYCIAFFHISGKLNTCRHFAKVQFRLSPFFFIASIHVKAERLSKK